MALSMVPDLGFGGCHCGAAAFFLGILNFLSQGLLSFVVRSSFFSAACIFVTMVFIRPGLFYIYYYTYILCGKRYFMLPLLLHVFFFLFSSYSML